jgi:hypothetical protein
MYRAAFIICIFNFILPVQITGAKNSGKSFRDDPKVFSGRLSRLNRKARLIRVKADFGNSKFLRIQDRVEFWNEMTPLKKCTAVVEGKSAEYFLMKVEDFYQCITKVGFTVGQLLFFSSKDLEFNLAVARELVDILFKKRLVLSGKMKRLKLELEGYKRKKEIIDTRYKALIDQVQREWDESIGDLEQIRSQKYQSFKAAEADVSDIDFKLHQYRVEDKNLTIDRWSLDPRLYYKK